MIKKNTKIVFEGSEGEKEQELVGGIPLTVGEIMNIHRENSEEAEQYEVIKKEIDCFMKGEDQIVDITYVLRRKI